ncbi:MAG: hypothetical protein ACO1N0_13175 [Fluviicola sp.]
MKITINDQRSISMIQKEFNTVFPYLKLEFFSRMHESEHSSSVRFLKKNNLLLGEFRTNHPSGEVQLSPEMKVSEIEELFKITFGLGVQVFRKSGKIWLETVYTDSWTLEEQNKEGEELSKGIEPEKPLDYNDRD